MIEENVIQIKSGITIIVDASVKKHFECKKGYIWNLATCSCKNRKYLVSIIDDLVSTCDKHIEETVPTNFNEKKSSLPQNLYILLAFFINYCSIINSCLYLLLSDKILSKTKTLIIIKKPKTI